MTVPKNVATQLAKELSNAVRNKSKFEVKSVTQSKQDSSRYQIVYKIHGVNFSRAFEQGLTKSAEEIKTEPSLTSSETQLQTVLSKNITNSLKEAKSKNKATEAKLVLKKESGK